MVVLREQDQELEDGTNMGLQGKVEVTVVDLGGKPTTFATLKVHPGMNHAHQFALVRVEYGFEPYPATLRDLINDSIYTDMYPDEFNQRLGEILSSDRVRGGLRRLLAENPR